MKHHVLFIHCAGPQGGSRVSNSLIAYLQKSLHENYHFPPPAVPGPEDPRNPSWKTNIKRRNFIKELRLFILVE
ncbi:hypothetical protein [Halobacillus campisalis]|uniref:Uncharacterized protein n=1 Tax=Halobacillus campisalis TaxID=435909 RepID=A0ABW2K6T3_9BACI|nr:hypothetical protein [Halobacillus campisalis]